MKDRPRKLPAARIRRLAASSPDTGSYRLVGHAHERMDQREVSLPEIDHVLRTGWYEPGKDEFKPEHNAWNYSWRGTTLDKRRLRIAFTPRQGGILVITVIDLNG